MDADKAMVAIEPLLRTALRGDPAVWSAGNDAIAGFLKYTKEQGVQPLLRYRLRESGSWPTWPAQIRDTLDAEAWRQAAFDLLLEKELRKVLDALYAAGVQPVLMKGAPLSAAMYPAPGLRPHADTDMLIDHAELERADRVLGALGYSPSQGVSGDLISHQSNYIGGSEPSRATFALDLHWKIMNPVLFADLLTPADARERAVPVAAFGPAARMLCPGHALLLACVHRIAHHHQDHSDRLVWLFDIHVLAGQMNPETFEQFAGLASEKQVRSLCAAGLDAAHAWFGTNTFEEITTRLLRCPEAATEPSARYLQDLRRVDLVGMDMSQLPWRGRLRLMREHVFPPADYMLHKYSVSSRLLLPALYFHRALTGAWKMLRTNAR